MCKTDVCDKEICHDADLFENVCASVDCLRDGSYFFVSQVALLSSFESLITEPLVEPQRIKAFCMQ